MHTPEEWAQRAREILDWLDANPGLSRELAAKGLAIELQRASREGALEALGEIRIGEDLDEERVAA